MLIAQTQCHIFIIVIKLYCTKVFGQYLWGGMGLRMEGGASKERGKCVTWSLVWVKLSGKSPDLQTQPPLFWAT